jgi:D-alanine-D-alanine ligase
MHIPYTHSGVMASAMAMDKVAAKRVVAAAGVASPRGLVVRRAELREREPIARPYVIKPINEGSSVGVRIVREGDNRPAVDDAAWGFGEEVLIEPFIPGRELTVSVMGDRALAVTDIQAKSGFYDYEAKYTDGRAIHVIPAEIGPKATQAALDAALAAHQALGCRGVSRSDFRYDDTQIENGGMGELYWLEVNTQPGMTALSLVPEQAAHLGISFPEICAWMVENAACDS